MTAMKSKYQLYLSIIIFLMVLPLLAQNTKKTDSILKAASNEIYINPDNAIKVGSEIVKNNEGKIEYTIKGYKLISDAYSSKRDYKKSLEYLIKASELLDQTNDKLLKINIINKTGIQYHQLKVYDKSMQFLDQAEQLIAEYPIKDSIHVELGKNYMIRGFIYKEKLSCMIAINYINKGIAEFRKGDKFEVASKISIAIYNKGNCYLLLNNNKLALESFKESVRLAREVNAKSLEAFALKGLAKVYTLEGKNAEAIKALNEALYLASGVNDLILNQEIYKGLAENYLAINNWNQFKINQQKFIEVQKLIKDRERISVSESLEVKEKELSVKRSELSNKFYYLILVLFIVLVLIVLFFYVVIKRKRKEIDTIKSQISTLQNKKMKEA
jgi:tetratricopeptide (TPR) repeat protein